MADEQQPIIIKKKKGGHGGHHGGAWKVAFADFMTAMMAFFLVMWLVNQSPEVREAIGGYFRDPGKYQMEGGSGVLRGSSSVLPNDKSKPAVPDKQFPSKGYGPSEEEKKKLSLTARSILNQLEKQEAFQRLKKNIKIQMTSEGLRIVLNESENSPAFFEPGSAKLLQKSAVILMTIAREIGKLDNRLVIEGHTSSSFTGTETYTNWELSADRANAARQLMEVSGLRGDQIREVRGFADQFPMIEHDPTDPRNRRVTLVLLYQAREKQYDEIEVGTDLIAQEFGQ
ncbi:OmpA family protein [candidate division GN15 bacterium]|nr:OmpA family protein [candidate division GN15 bacterium]